MSFIDSLQTNTNRSARTENNALTNLSTLDPVLDYFSRAGAMRGREAEACTLYKKAHAQDQNLALKTLFYLRDVRGGQGERSVFRSTIKEMTDDEASKLARFIPEYGRWDDLFYLPQEDVVTEIVKTQLAEDQKNMEAGKPVSLLAKWLPSENASSSKSKAAALKLAKALGLKPSQYRRQVVALRKYIKLLEQQMSSKEWDKIQYDKIPSQAHRKHVKAFKRNDDERYQAFLGQVEKGEKKINAKTLFTYEIYEMMYDYSSNGRTADALWAALPDYTNGQNALVLADVSGSMSGRPMAISVSLALYFAERNEGPFKDYFMTFSAKPLLQKVVGKTLTDRMNSISNAHWDMNTNIEAAFKAILKAAIDNNASKDEMPQVLYIISDMEFDESYIEGNEATNFEAAKHYFSEAGYELPHLVFWTVDSRNDQSPATKFDDRVTLISGSSQSTFQYAVAGKTPLESMNDILNSDRYAQIKV